ncbi:Sushi repeat-containing protein SRPX2 [Holothuria leucospilota]|uniref:Sushi repeat-containing protein SRPX2 n=1 Tax=Holothuria leucospilota TaxID=206669 RepID=A0A9Q1H0Y8_HOLLE|nr:Sushi repeat-containing protein SRPX2 [Holothuria leucospilota]
MDILLAEDRPPEPVSHQKNGMVVHLFVEGTRTCQSSEEWSGSAPICQDITPPHITCPQSFVVYADAGYNSTLVSWIPPNSTDNTGLPVTIEQLSGPTSRSVLEAGPYAVQYNASDEARNKASCHFSIVVNQIKCPYLIGTKIQRVDCPLGHIYGAECNISCAPGYFVNGSDTMACKRYGTPPTGNWDVDRPSCGRYSLIGSSSRHCLSRQGDSVGYWDGEEVMCEAFPCPSPYLPPHGLFRNGSSSACSLRRNVPQGTVCIYQCEEGFFRVGTDTLSCGVNGRWSDDFPVCERAGFLVIGEFITTCDRKAVAIPRYGYRSDCYTSSMPYGSICTLGCYPGYMPDTPSKVTCVVDVNGENVGKWQGNIITECHPISCVPYDPPDHGFIKSCNHEDIPTNTTKLQPYQSVCVAACDYGYTPFGSISRSCIDSGLWDGNPLECKEGRKDYKEKAGSPS